MDGSKKASKTKKKEDAEMIDTSSKDQEFVDKMKKRATVKTYGIDNVSAFILISLSMLHSSIPQVSRL